VYSGTTLTPLSGKILGAHQKFDRLARRNLAALMKDNDKKFPTAKEILKFEGLNGPDGIKRKSPAQDEPWHYINPFDTEDKQLITIIATHHDELAKALANQNATKAAFEAAWLAHAIVDGLTPAHHFPYEEELQKLRGGEGLETRNTIMNKVIMPGATPTGQLKNNWKMWGPKGLLSTHGFFEFGVATLIAPRSFKDTIPQEKDVQELKHINITELFLKRAQEIAALDLYTKYYKTGWTPKLARQIRKQLVPAILQVITLSWYSAAYKAGVV
jgi:hypothetical protein